MPVYRNKFADVEQAWRLSTACLGPADLQVPFWNNVKKFRQNIHHYPGP